MHAFRATLLGGAGFHAIASDLLVMALFAGVVLPFGVWLLGWAVRRARKEGTLAFY